MINSIAERILFNRLFLGTIMLIAGILYLNYGYNLQILNAKISIISLGWILIVIGTLTLGSMFKKRNQKT